MDNWLVFLKFFSVAMSAFFGVLALLTEYKDKSGKITSWGRVALVGVLISAFITASSQAIEMSLSQAASQRNQERALAQLQANSDILFDIRRSLNPLDDVRASYWLVVELDHPELKSFKTNFLAEVQELKELWEDHPSTSRISAAYPSVRNMDGSVVEITVPQSSPLFPNREEHRFAYTVFEHSDITLRFYREPIEIDQFPFFGSIDQSRFDKIKDPDLEMGFEQNYDDGSDKSLEYNFEDQQFLVRGSDIKSDKRYWDNSGEFVSALDLVGSQVFITAGHALVSFEEREKRVHPRLGNIVLDIGDRKGLWLSPSLLTEHLDPTDGEIVYEYRFPDEWEILISTLTR